MKYWYIGSFPPPYGGVTKKNILVYETLKKGIDIQRVDEHGKIGLLKQVLLLFKRNYGYVIGIGSMKMLKYYMMLMSIFDNFALKKSIIMVPGGVFHLYVEKAGKWYLNILKRVKTLYVETDGMKEYLEKLGLNNVKVFPNCRNNSIKFQARRNIKRPLKCLYFSMVSNKKGVDIFLDAAEELPDIQFDIYGELNMDDLEKSNFEKKCSKLTNVMYKGCFKGLDEELYSLLNEYDLLVLPSRWKFEGVPGVLVEAKIAALPAIVSNINFNCEVIKNGKEGIVLEKNDKEHLIEAIVKLNENRDLLFQLAVGARKSAERYLVNYYEKSLIENLNSN